MKNDVYKKMKYRLLINILFLKLISELCCKWGQCVCFSPTEQKLAIRKFQMLPGNA